MAGGMQERFQQELDLTRDLPAEAYKADRAKVVETMRQMIKEGFITLKPHGAAPLKPAANPLSAIAPKAVPAAAGAKHPAGPSNQAGTLPPLPGSKPSVLPPLAGGKPSGADMKTAEALPSLAAIKPSALPPLAGNNPPAPDNKPLPDQKS
jgi:hypothetical protein